MVPLDMSELATRALDMAAMLAVALGSRLIVFSAVGTQEHDALQGYATSEHIALDEAADAYLTRAVRSVPADIDTYCPGYREAGTEERKAFWVTFLSALAKHESTWRPDVAGGGGAWFGLLQISPRTAQGYGCRAQSPEALKDGGNNLSCAIRIMAVTVPRDGVISAGMNGVAADWGPFHQTEKRADIQSRTRNSAVCRG